MNKTIPNSVDSCTELQSSDARKLLDFLPVLYPGGHLWLSRRIDDVNAGRAIAHTAWVDGTLVGLSLGSLKKSGRFKISTLFVHPSNRSSGVGRTLLDSMLASAAELGSGDVYITGADTVREQLLPVLCGANFELIATERDRYGVGRNEDVYLRRS